MNDGKALRQRAEAEGLKFQRITKHASLYIEPETGLRWGMSTTPSDINASKQAERDLNIILAVRHAKRAEELNQPKEPTMNKIADEAREIAEARLAHRLDDERNRLLIPTTRCNTCRKLVPSTEFSTTYMGTTAKSCNSCRERRKTDAQQRSVRKESLQRVQELPRYDQLPEPVLGVTTKDPEYSGVLRSSTPSQDPEAMATRVLVKRHKAEHDELVETFMEGLWGS